MEGSQCSQSVVCSCPLLTGFDFLPPGLGLLRTTSVTALLWTSSGVLSCFFPVVPTTLLPLPLLSLCVWQLWARKPRGLGRLRPSGALG